MLDEALPSKAGRSRDEARLNFELLGKQVASSQKRVKELSKEIPAEFLESPERKIPASMEPAQAKLIREYQGSYRLLQQRLKD